MAIDVTMSISKDQENDRMYQKLLVPVDGSEHSARAVAAAIELVTCIGASVHLVHVIRDLSLPKEIRAMIASGEITAPRMQILQDSADIILDKARSRFEAAGIDRIEVTTLMGDPADKILQYAAQNGIDLIVLGQRGLAPHENLLGGVARKLVNMTRIACLIVT
jgi:nucleotide-binding universal stress UspA family protein